MVRRCLSYLGYLAVLGSGSALRAQPAAPLLPPAEKRYSKQQVEQDIGYLTAAIGRVHPNMYHAISPQQYQRLTDSVRAALPDSLTEQQAWPLLGRLVGALQEGHSSLEYTKHEVELLRSGRPLLFPLVLQAFDGQNFIVRADASADNTLQAGDEITRLNGLPAVRLLDQLSTYTGGLRSHRAIDVCRNITAYMHLYNIPAPYRITYRRGQVLDSLTVSPVTFADYKSRLTAQKTTSSPKPAEYALTFPAPTKALLQLNSFRANPPVFRQFLDSTFTVLQKQPVTTLVIDLRQNGGGNSALAEMLLGYLTTKPFRMAGGARWKVSQEYKDQLVAQLKKTGEPEANYANYLAAPVGTILTAPAPKPARLPPNPLAYSGKVRVLIGPKTFSSANMLANTIEDYRLAPLLGEASGEPANDYGELIYLHLPNTGIPFTCSTKQFVRANGDGRNPRPVVPTKRVLDDPLTATDEVVAYALST